MVEEEEGRVKVSSGAAPLADQETEDDDFRMKEEEFKVRNKQKQEQEQIQIHKAEIETKEVKLPQHRSITRPSRARSFPNLYCAHQRIAVPSSSTCPSLLHIFCNAQPQWHRHPRKTASAPSVTEENPASVENSGVTLVESLKAVATEPVIKKATMVSTEQHRIFPPTYLSPQPSRMLRRLRQSPIGNNKVRPTSVSVSSIDHDLQKLSRTGAGVCSSYGAPPWTRQSTTDLPPTPQVHVGPLCIYSFFQTYRLFHLFSPIKYEVE